MFSNTLNNWFYDQEVQPADMKLITQTLLQLCFASNGGEVQAMGITPTINGNQINTTKGFVYFGETSNQTYIDNTGTNQLIAFVAPAVTSIVNADCFLYIKPNITTDPSNLTSTVTGVLYTSVSANDDGVQLATIANNIITVINSINPNGATSLQRGVVSLGVLNGLFAKLASPNIYTSDNTFNGVTRASTLPVGTNDNRVATMAAIIAALSNYTSNTITPMLNAKANINNPTFTENIFVGPNGIGINYLTGLFSPVPNCPNTFGIKFGWDGQQHIRYIVDNNSSVTAPLANLSDVTANGIGIVNSGGNANGTWVKFGNGLLICWGISGGNSPRTVTLPSFYSGTPTVFVTNQSNNSGVAPANYNANTSSFTVNYAQLVSWFSIGY